MNGAINMGSAFDPDVRINTEKTIVFAGATPDAIGDFDGTGKTATIFTVTGTVLARVIAVCTVNVAHAANATIEVGIGGGSTIIATTDLTAQEMVVQEIWHDATPDSEIELASVSADYIITDGNDITLDCGVANTNTGSIRFNCLWRAISSDGLVV